jgi:hypothetical protein
MPLKEKYEMFWTEAIHQRADEHADDVQMYLGALVGTIGACIIGIATDIDLLRNELVTKGVLEA